MSIWPLIYDDIKNLGIIEYESLIINEKIIIGNKN